MTDDIVWRLRHTHPPHHAVEPLMREAAHEIERLRTDLAEVDKYNNWQQAVLEIKRLRTQLILCEEINAGFQQALKERTQ